MKTNIHFNNIALLLIMFIYFNNANGQLISWTMSGNTNISGSILGTTTGNFPLEIKNGASYPINFYTNGSQRATILAGVMLV